jgi:asparagine synthase (glutamine-hydrolysing)
LKEKIEDDLPMSLEETNTSYANIYECWDWRERQSKYIINSVRTYEFFGFDWWLPLWDKEFVEFWCRVPLLVRKERLWYNEVVSKIYESQAGDRNSLAKKNAAEKSMFRKLAHATYPILPKYIKKCIYKRKLRADFENHFLQLGSLLSKPQKVENNKYNYTIIGIYNRLYLKNEWGKK